jgi:hypothetical protein
MAHIDKRLYTTKDGKPTTPGGPATGTLRDGSG